MINDPFRYVPSEDVIKASREVISYIDNNARELFSEGKMLGVLVVATGKTYDKGILHPIGNGLGFIAAFSGTAGGKACIPYFVPPIFDITEPGGYFREKEAEIVIINREIGTITESEEYRLSLQALRQAEETKEKEVSDFRNRIAVSKREREEIRAGLGCDRPEVLAALAKESQFEKAELRRLIKKHDEEIREAGQAISALKASVKGLKAMRQKMSDELQQWIFRQYKVLNARGEEADVLEIFSEHGLVPPGGTGDCAAPKLLQYAFKHGLRPVSMGEFWYGDSPASSVRIHGHFYPSCRHKCGPLLGFMLQGLEVRKDDSKTWYREPVIIYEDDAIIVADKPSGMLSAPGLNGERSLQEYLEETVNKRSPDKDKILSVHRLDMDTSGVIIYAKTEEAQRDLQRQFEEGTVRKEYRARLCASAGSLIGSVPAGRVLAAGDKGLISLPLSSDYEDRPRQKADRLHGKEAVTDYEVTSILPSGEADIIFRPANGRTHQLRVHSAHPSGLGRPIKGDRLYGGCIDGYDGPLHLKASSVTFCHPVTKEILTFKAVLS